MARKAKEEITTETPIQLQEKCIVKTVSDNNIGVYFKGFGISVLTKNQYNIGDEVTINYKSDIGKSNFKYWIDEE